MMLQPSQRALAAYICRATDLLKFGWPVFPHSTYTIASFQLSSLVKEIFTLALKIGLSPLRSLGVIDFRWDHCRPRYCSCSTILAWFCSSSITLEMSFGLAWLITGDLSSTPMFRFRLPYGMSGHRSQDRPLPSRRRPPALR